MYHSPDEMFLAVYTLLRAIILLKSNIHRHGSSIPFSLQC